MSDPRKFIFNSNYPIDKIVFLDERTVTPNSDGDFDVSFNHGLGAVPFIKAVASDDDWETTYPSGIKIISGNWLTPTDVFMYFEASSNGTNVRLRGNLDDTIPVKIRTWGFFNESDTLNVDAPATANASSNKFILNTKYNYQSLVKEGYAETQNGAITVAHNLGFVPFVDVWVQDSNGRWKNLDDFSCFVSVPSDNQSVNYTNLVKVDNFNVTFNKDQITNNHNYYYRIYAHEAV